MNRPRWTVKAWADSALIMAGGPGSPHDKADDLIESIRVELPEALRSEGSLVLGPDKAEELERLVRARHVDDKHGGAVRYCRDELCILWTEATE